MTVAMTDTVLNVSGALRAKKDNSTRLLDAIYTMGKSSGDGIVATGVRKVNSTLFTVASPYEDGDGEQPAITETQSLTATDRTPVTRTQEKNCVQIFQDAVAVSYLKQSAVGNLSGLNLANKSSNVTNEFDWQLERAIVKMKKDLHASIVNGTFHEASSNADAYKTGGIIEAIKSNTATYGSGSTISEKLINQAIVGAQANGFNFSDGSTMLWCNSADLDKINEAFSSEKGFNLPDTRTEGGIAIRTILTNFGYLGVNYDVKIPVGTFLILNMNELAVTELDVPNKGCFFYEALAKTGAGERGQLYGQAGLDFGAEWQHIKITQGE